MVVEVFYGGLCYLVLGYCCRRVSILYSIMIGLEKKVEKGG